jgi:phage terminase large subunit-like protein
VIEFFEHCLYHTVGQFAGRPFTLLPFQREILAQLFGTLLPDGRRQYRTALLELPRKNGKSALGSGIALYMLTMDDVGARVYSVAGDRDQARVVFGTAVDMLEASPELQAAFRPKIYRDVVEIPSTGSLYKVLSADAPRQHGLNPSAVIFDELHVQRGRELWDAMSSGSGTRREPLTLAITTSGHDRHSIAFELHEYARQIREGVITDASFFSRHFGAANDDDWTNRDVWRAANPALGHFLSAEFLEQEFTQASMLPARQNMFRQLYLNQWVEQSTRWIDVAAWDACANAGTNETRISTSSQICDEVKSAHGPNLKGRRCFGGLDLASVQDISALVLAFPGEDGVVDVLPFFWIPEDGLRERALRDYVPYQQWVHGGFIRTMPGRVTDNDVIYADIRELATQYHIESISYDRWNASQLIIRLEADGALCLDTGQGYASLTAPTKELERRILAKTIRHDANPVLRWMVNNVATETDAAGNIKPSKKKSTQRIDGVVALVMALDRVVRESAPVKTIYDVAPEDFDPNSAWV